MKKNYICPNMEVVEIGFNHPLLAGSTTLPDPIPPGVSSAPEFELENDVLGNF
jgi:hypothetical protein